MRLMASGGRPGGIAPTSNSSGLRRPPAAANRGLSRVAAGTRRGGRPLCHTSWSDASAKGKRLDAFGEAAPPAQPWARNAATERPL
jgi:hypothetical protein